MKLPIQTLGVLALATAICYAEEGAAKPEKHKAPNHEAMFKKLDANSDGSVSLDEFKASPRGKKDPAKAEAAFKKIDANADGNISLDEFKAVGPPKGGHGGKKPK